jgi:hypothetical protein
VQVSLLPGLFHHPRHSGQLLVRVPGAHGTLIGSAPRVLVSAPSHLLTTRACLSVGLAQGCRVFRTGGFLEFTRFFHNRFRDWVTNSMSPLL